MTPVEESAEPQVAVEVREIRAEADGVLTLALAPADGRPLPGWEPGAHVDLLIDDGVERQYSLCGEPGSLDRWEIAVLREPQGRGGSEFIHTAIKVGDRVCTRGPRNHFRLEKADSYLFIAGGIGITPIVPMLRRAIAAGVPWRLLYGGRSRPSMAFAEDLAALGERVEIRPQDEFGLLDLGLLDRPSPGTLVYCCGPEALLAAVEARCADWPSGALHVERFAPKEGALEGRMGGFEVRCELSGVTVRVEPDESIVEAVEREGIEVMTSCREGTCGSCETAVLEGTPDHRDSVLTDSEREAGDVMMTCCSRSLTPRLVLEL